MDEQRLAVLFRDAVGEPPPASFGRDDVVAASRRATARRRSAVAGGTVFGVVMLVAGLAAGGQVLPGQPGTTTQGPSPPVDRSAPEPGAQPWDPVAPHPLGARPGTRTPSPRSGAMPGGQVPCGPPDEALEATMTAVLAGRGTEVAGPAGGVPGSCPAGTRAAALPVAGGTVYLVVLPRIGPVEPETVTQPDGRRAHTRALDDGRGLVVISMPAAPGRSAPLGDELPDLATQLAARL